MNRPTCAVLVGLALVAVTGCQPDTSAPATSHSPTPSAATPTPAVDLTHPKAARRAVDELVKAAGGLKVIKVDVSATSATLSALKDGKVVAWGWSNGVTKPVESDIQYIQQAAFDPSAYALDDLAGIFAQAARISGSSSNQELQIIEYDQGRVLMTVTTRPESMPVFFRADASPVNQLEVPSTAAFAEAIRDTTATGHRPLTMGWDAQSGFWADQASTQPGVILRMTRQARVPSWAAERKGASTGPTFPEQAVDPAVLSRQLTSLPTTIGRPGVPVSFRIERLGQMATPVITFDVGGQKVVTTLGGTDITDVIGG